MRNLPCRILVVDDNEDAAESLALLLGTFGYEVRTAFDGEAALSSAEGFRPDVVLLDIGLPRLSGHEVARQIRGQAWGSNMTLIALTGWSQESDRKLSEDAGFDRHLVKPVDTTALLGMLSDAAQRESEGPIGASSF